MNQYQQNSQCNKESSCSDLTDVGLPVNPLEHGAQLRTPDMCGGGPTRRIAIDLTGTSVLPMPSLGGSKRAPLSSCPPLSTIADDSLKTCFPQSDPLLPGGLCTDDLMMDFEDEIETPSSPVKEWKVRDECVPTLPMLHPLDRNAVFVSQTSASDITERIRSALHDRVTDVTFHPEIALAKCVSKANVEFRVRLYRGRGEYRHGFVVEVQRLDGFDFSYQMDVFAILEAAQGMQEKSVMAIPTLPSPTFLNVVLANQIYNSSHC